MLYISIEKSSLALQKQPAIAEQNEKCQNKKKKGLEEKDLDFEEMFDDDQEEDHVAEEESESSLDENNLCDDGKLIKNQILEQDAESKEKPMNLNFEVEVVAEESKDGDGSDSSMASIFGEQEENEEGSASQEVGSKRTLTESTVNESGAQSGEIKRQKKD